MNQRKFEKPVPILPLQENVMTDYSTGFTIKRVPGGLLRIDLFKGAPVRDVFLRSSKFLEFTDGRGEVARGEYRKTNHPRAATNCGRN